MRGLAMGLACWGSPVSQCLLGHPLLPASLLLLGRAAPAHGWRSLDYFSPLYPGPLSVSPLCSHCSLALALLPYRSLFGCQKSRKVPSPLILLIHLLPPPPLE